MSLLVLVGGQDGRMAGPTVWHAKERTVTLGHLSYVPLGGKKNFTCLLGKGRGAKKRKASGSENEGDYNPGRRPSKTASKVSRAAQSMGPVGLPCACSLMERLVSGLRPPHQ